MINSRWWMLLASLVAGPVLTFGYWAADVFLLNPGLYPSAFQGDALATLWRLSTRRWELADHYREEIYGSLARRN